MRPLRRLAACAGWAALALLGSGAGLAAPPAATESYPDLPPRRMVERALLAHPSVQAARAALRIGDADRAKLRAGPYETSLQADLQRRQVVPAPEQRFGEWGLALSRPLRLPGKAALDAQLGDNAVALARYRYGDALHQAGRRLLGLWFAWVTGYSRAREWRHQVAVLEEQLRVVRKRVRGGDAPRRELILAESALARAQASLQQALLRRRVAANDLAIQFPAIALPAAPQLRAPEPLGRDLAYWRGEVLAHDLRLALARGEVEHWRLAAARARRDLTPDPTVGLHYARERGGEERVFGVSISIPLPGEARSAGVRAAEARVDVAQRQAAAVAAAVTAETDNLYSSAMASYRNWRAMRAAQRGMQRSADLMTRAYALGEGSLSDVLTARRQAIEVRESATLAEIGAAQDRYRLLLDARRLWALDADATH